MLPIIFPIILVISSPSVYAQSETNLPATPVTGDAPHIPSPRQQSSISGEINDRGEFVFHLNSDVDNYHISIYGSIDVNNITQAQTLKISGQYKFGNYSINFRANEIEGFQLLPIKEPEGVSLKTATSILGKR